MYKEPSAGPKYLIEINITSIKVHTPSPPKLKSLPMPSCQCPK